MGQRLIWFPLLLLFLFPLVSAVPPITSEFVSDKNLVIEATFSNYYKIGEPAQIFIHVFNKTSGEKLDNTTVDCDVELTNRNGTLILSGTPSYTGHHWLMTRSASVITESGIYAVSVFCNSTDTSGYKSVYFEANMVGSELTEARSLLYLGFLGLFVLVLFLNFLGMSYLPDKNTRDEEGKLMSISYLKYFRNVLWMVGYGIFLMIVYLASNIAFAFLEQEMMAKALFMIFQVGYMLAPVIVVVWGIYILAQIIDDKRMKQLLNRGMFSEGNF